MNVDFLGTLHLVFAIAALICGPSVFFRVKGDSIHKRIGYVYVVSMVLLNVSALAIYELTGTWNAFHWFALISLLTLACGVFPVVLRRPSKSWLGLHYHFICWSYVGLVAAAISETFTRLPDQIPALQEIVPDNYFWMALGVCIAIAMAAGAYLITFRQVGYPPKTSSHA